ncbi:hypothetical protein EDB92DRAFT_251967 [Lactarius akahatsu]|uniref:Uncharacterized protein n=1 Tax=Lactarius akahatsu TaxID=416441 RepID=A0AAD4LLN0_9AGAM|nr:hypothetical protein EDB92DRAFT_251967 [Lactarius akahatsu]
MHRCVVRAGLVFILRASARVCSRKCDRDLGGVAARQSMLSTGCIGCAWPRAANYTTVDHVSSSSPSLGDPSDGSPPPPPPASSAAVRLHAPLPHVVYSFVHEGHLYDYHLATPTHWHTPGYHQARPAMNTLCCVVGGALDDEAKVCHAVDSVPERTGIRVIMSHTLNFEDTVTSRYSLSILGSMYCDARTIRSIDGNSKRLRMRAVAHCPR